MFNVLRKLQKKYFLNNLTALEKFDVSGQSM